MARHEVCPTDDLPDGARKIVQVNERLSIGVFNVAGVLVAYQNYCPHAGAPVCEGTLSGAIVSDKPFERSVAHEGLILKCPWHAWEFLLPEGTTLTQPAHRLRSYPVHVEDRMILVEVSSAPSRAAEKETA